MRNPFYHRQGIADPGNFYGRGALVRSLFEMIDSGQSCAVVGERRIGKSSLLSYLADTQVQETHQLGAHRILSVVLDFMALHTSSPAELWLEILEGLELSTQDDEAIAILEGAIEATDLGFSHFRRTLKKLKRRGYRVVLLCDEFELAVHNPKFDARFFGALRSLAGGVGVVFVTASRQSLLELGQYHQEEVRQKVLGSPFFNIFAEFTLGPFEDYEVAEWLAGSLDNLAIRMTADDVAFLNRLGGRHPYCLQLTAYHLFEELQKAGLGRSLAHRVRSRPAEELDSRWQKCHSEVRERVRRESAKIFRNQWKHSPPDEALALSTLASREPQNPEGVPPSPGPLDGRVLARLITRGLVKEAPNPKGGRPRRYRDTTQNARRFRIFSELFSEWITHHVTTPIGEEVPSRPPATTEPTTTPDPEFDSSHVDRVIPERYRVLEELGRGGAGTVFKAWDQRLERLVAIKVLDLAIRNSDRLEPLLVEARTCAALHHPHIVTIFDIDPDGGFLVQEFLAGGSLRDLLEMLPILPIVDLLTLTRHLGSALGAAHRAGVVHRDLKPENILLSARPPLRGSQSGQPLLAEIKLADFGTALRFSDFDRLAERRSVTGTLAYMSPEQLAGKEAGPSADLYSLGVVVHEARYGILPPRVGETTTTVPEMGGTERRPDVLDQLMIRCLARFPKERFATADDLLSAVRDAQNVLARPQEVP